MKSKMKSTIKSLITSIIMEIPIWIAVFGLRFSLAPNPFSRSETATPSTPTRWNGPLVAAMPLSTRCSSRPAPLCDDGRVGHCWIQPLGIGLKSYEMTICWGINMNTHPFFAAILGYHPARTFFTDLILFFTGKMRLPWNWTLLI